MQATQSLQELRSALSSLRHGQIAIAGICQLWRSHLVQLTTLPPRYAEVAEDILGRLEAGSLFTEESCSFSQKDLLDNLDIWLDKAELQLKTIAVAATPAT
ncbi:hypothetical protein [Glaciimonas soli]|uniref:Uncharacterized protein n=1 Tax=Glaciimonas soli TaxID=2590999 RepID=A0A843YV45_9BURK|nr:hypothetical protein [Glaciimonas soli]MQR01867.1 hypothetical protein [Glaciimonas soli]